MTRTLLCLLLFSSTPAFTQPGEVLLTGAAEPDHRLANASSLPVLLDEEVPTMEVAADAFELVSFQADPQDGTSVLVQFATLAEGRMEQFVVERSADRIHWEVALEVPGNGLLGEYTNYEVLDLQPLQGLSYYRLGRRTTHGTAVVSDLYSVRHEGRSGLLIHGDVLPGHFVVRANGEITELLLLNNRGQFVPMQLTIQGDLAQLNAERLEPGVYYVQAIVNGTSVMRPVHIRSDMVIGG